MAGIGCWRPHVEGESECRQALQSSLFSVRKKNMVALISGLLQRSPFWFHLNPELVQAMPW